MGLQRWMENLRLCAISSYYVTEDNIGYYWSKNFELGDHTGEVAVVTAGHRGLGAEITKDLLTTGMHVILGCRKVEDGTKFISSLRERGVTGGKVTIRPLDLASLESVRNFVDAVLRETFVINYIVNNAGIISYEYRETEDKFESNWQVNYLGHFLMAHLLLPTLQSSPGCAKIISVSSLSHRIFSRVDYENTNNEKYFDRLTAYAKSKLAQVMFTLYLNAKLKSINSKVEVVAVHPGCVATDIFHETPMRRLIGLPVIKRLIFKTTEMGGKSIVYAILHGKGGEYIGNCAPQSTSSLSKNLAEQQKLFEFSKKSLQISLFGNMF